MAAAIESALAQTRPADEVLVVDDASTDATRAIATDVKWESRVRYVYNDNSTGFADAFNRVTVLAGNEFVVLLSADDVLHPSFLEAVEAGLLAYPEAKFCYVAADYIDGDGKLISPRAASQSSVPRLYDGKAYIHNYISGCLNNAEIHRCAGTVIERKLFVERCRFRKEAGIMADNDLFIRIAAETNVVGIALPLASVRVHADAISARMESLNLRVAKDYLFQIRFLASEAHTVAAPDVAMVHALAFRSINLLMQEALLRGRPDLYAAAIRIVRELELTIGADACCRSIAQIGSLLRLIYRHRSVGWLYGWLVSAAALAKPLKRATYRVFFTRKRGGVPLLEP